MNFELAPWMPCVNCNAPMIVQNTLFDSYYEQEDIVCNECNKKIDFDEQIEKAIDLNLMNNNTFQLLGLPSKIFKIIIKPEERKTLKFSAFGIPEDARIVYVNYTPQNGNGFPVQIHGNTPYIDFPQQEVTLFPLSFPGETKGDLEVSLFIMWSENKETEVKYLIDGFHQYNISKYEDMIIPLNIALESYITNTLFRYFEQTWNSKVANRLIKKLEYSYIVNSILEDMAEVNGWIKISKQLRKKLTALLELRNQIAHTGKSDSPIDKNLANDIIKTVVLAYHYCRLINQAIEEE